MAIPDLPAWVPTGLMVNQCSNEDCCGNGKVCPRCNFGVSDCRVWWDCPSDVVETEVYRDTTLISTDSYGVIGQPAVGQYRIRRRCNGIWYSEFMGTIGSAICGNCCESIGRAACSQPVVLTLSGLPAYPAWDGWNGSFVMDCVDGFTDRCYRSLGLIKSFPGCTGAVPTTNIYTDDLYMQEYSLSFIWDSFVGAGPLGRVTIADSVFYSRRISPSVCEENFGSLGGSNSTFNTTECKLPITGTITRAHPSQYFIFGLEFASFFGPSVATYSFDFSIA